MTLQQPSQTTDATGTGKPGRSLAAALAVVLLLAVSTLPIFAVADLPGNARGTVAVVFPPGTERSVALAAIAEANGLVVRGGGWGSVLVAYSDEVGFAQRLRRAGAWLVVDPRSAAGCLITGTTNASD